MKKQKKQLYLLGILIMLTGSYNAQNFKWAKGYGGTSNDAFKGITTDGQKNAISVGASNSVFTTTTSTITNNGGSDVLIIKNDFLGNLVWAQSFGSTGNDVGNSITVDGANNIYVCGSFSGNMIVGTNTLTSVGGLDMFVIKLSPTGSVLNALSYGGSGDDSYSSIAVNTNGDLFIGGYFSNSINFGTGSISSAGGHDLVITKFNSSFTNLWVKKTGGTVDDEVSALCIDKVGNIFVTGKFQNTFSFPTLTQVPFPLATASGHLLNGNPNGPDIFVLKQSASTGDFIWATPIWSGNTESSYGITCDDAGNACYVVGDFSSSSSFGQGASATNTNGGSDGFLAKFDGNASPPAPSCLFIKPIGGTGNESARKVAYSKKGIAVTGNFAGVSTFGNGISLTAYGSNDAFISLYDSLGTCLFAKKTGGTTFDEGYGVTINNNKHIFFNGSFSSTNALFSPLPLIAQVGAGDAFVTRLDLLPDTAHICVVSVDTTSTFNIVYWDKTGIDTAAIDSFIIYRGFPSSIKIGSKHKSDTSLFRDINFPINQTPNNLAHPYKLGTKDAYGNVSPITGQLYHKVLFLTAAYSTSVTNLSWNNYSDENNIGYVDSYDIYRDVTGSGPWIPLATAVPASGPTISYIDNAPSTNPLSRYLVEMNLAFPCFYSKKGGPGNGILAQKVKTKSNHANDKAFTTSESKDLINTSLINIYPNPVKEILTVDFAMFNGFQNTTITISNLFGQILLTESVTSLKHNVNTANLLNGVYFLNIINERNPLMVKKIVIEK